MNAIPQIDAGEADAKAREAAHEELALTEHYCRCARLHLQVADDPVTILDLLSARRHFAAALRAFSPIKETIARGATLTKSEVPE